MKKISVLIVDDHPIYSIGLKEILKDFKSIKSVKIVDTGELALQYLKKNLVDIIFLDLIMPHMDGWKTLSELRIFKSPPKIIIISSLADHSKIKFTLEQGIDGFISKNTSVPELETAIQKVLSGEKYFSKDIRDAIFVSLVEEKPQNISLKKTYENLSQRELSILKLLAENFSNAEIGEQLNISEYTVKRHRQNLLNKTNAKGIRDLIVLAYKLGLKKLDE